MTIDIFGPAGALNVVTSRPSDGRAFGNVDSFFRDCTTPSSQDGTQVAAAWLNQVTGVLRAIARVNGLKTDGIDPVVPYDQTDAMAINAIMQLIQRGRMTYGVDTGPVNTLIVTVPVTPAELLDGMQFTARIGNTNTIAGATLNVNELGGFPVVKQSGAVLAPGDLVGGTFGTFRFDATINKYRAVGLQKSDVVVPDTSIWHIGAASGPSTAYTTTLTPVPLAATNGLSMRVSMNVVNGASPTLDFGFGPKPVVLNASGAALTGGEMSGWADMTYNGTVLELLDPVPSAGSQITNLLQYFVGKVTSAAAVTVTYGMSANQPVTSNVNTAVAITGGTSPFSQIGGGGIQITQAGRYFITGTLLADTLQPSGELQYSSLLIFKNGGLLTQTTISNYSYGEILVALNVGTAAFLAVGDILNLNFYTHSQNNDDHNDVIQASSTSFTLVFLG